MQLSTAIVKPHGQRLRSLASIQSKNLAVPNYATRERYISSSLLRVPKRTRMRRLLSGKVPHRLVPNWLFTTLPVYSTRMLNGLSTSSMKGPSSRSVGLSPCSDNVSILTRIGSYFSRPLWSQVPKIAYTESTIKYAMIALSKFHEQYTTSSEPRSALNYYTRAIQELRSGLPTTTGILCLMIFFAIEVGLVLTCS